jgi:hypothetical protein
MQRLAVMSAKRECFAQRPIFGAELVDFLLQCLHHVFLWVQQNHRLIFDTLGLVCVVQCAHGLVDVTGSRRDIDHHQRHARASNRVHQQLRQL